MHFIAVCCSVSPCVVVVCCSVLQCVAVRCSVLRCVAVCCSVLQCVAAPKSLCIVHIVESQLLNISSILKSQHYVHSFS